MRNGEVSYWWQALGGFPPRRTSLPGPIEADVCIVGGGYTGLWTAYYRAERGPRGGVRRVRRLRPQRRLGDVGTARIARHLRPRTWGRGRRPGAGGGAAVDGR